MWVLLGLFAALSATAVIDGLQGPGSDAEDDSEDVGQDRSDPAGADQASYQSILTQMVAMRDADAYDTAFSMPNPDDTGLFDNLSERIHSSDKYPPALPPQPSFLDGTDGDDRLVGGASDDTLQGGGGNDTLIGAAGDDLLLAGRGDNHLVGGEGDDSLIGGMDNDTLEGGWGDDLLVAGGGDNLLMGGAGDDVLIGARVDEDGADQSGANILNGGSGDDVLIAGQGDSLHGGEGGDQFILGDWLAGQEAATILDFNSDVDQIVLYYDASQIEAPEVTVTFDDDNPTVAQIRLNGHAVATVLNAPDLTAQDLVLMTGLPEQMAIAAE